MPVSNEDTRVEFTGNGVDQSPYTIPFPLRDDDDIRVDYITDTTRVKVTKTKTTDYTITLGVTPDFATASLTLVTAAPATGETMIITRDSQLTQANKFEGLSSIPGATLDDTNDRITMVAQSLQDQLDRAIQVDYGHPDANLPLARFNLVGNSLKHVRVNLAEDAFELVVATDSIGDGTITPAMLQNGTAENQVLQTQSTPFAFERRTNGIFNAMTIKDTGSHIVINESDAAANNQLMGISQGGTQALFQFFNDALTAATWLSVTRSAQTAQAIVLTAAVDIHLNSVVKAGFGPETLTNAAGEVLLAALVAPVGSNVIVGEVGSVWAEATITSIGVDPTTDLTVPVPDAQVDNDLTISGGTVDASVIGGVTPAAGSFTTIAASGIVTANAGVAITAAGSHIVITEDDGAADNQIVVIQQGGETYLMEFLTDALAAQEFFSATRTGNVANQITFTADTLVSIPTGDLTVAAGDIKATAGDVIVGGSVIHAGDTNTNMAFTDDQIIFNVGGVEFIKIVEAATDQIVINEAGADVNVRMEGVGQAFAFSLDGANGRIGIGEGAAAGQLHANQNDASGAIPTLVLEQADIDDTFVNLIGTSAADSTRSISSSTAEAAAKFGAYRVEINGVTKWVRVYDSAV